MLGANPVIVVLVVEPEIFPGLITQFPAGNPLSATLPVATVHVGCVMVPTIGAEGVAGNGFITALKEADEIQPTELVTVKLYVFGTNPVIVVLVVDPVIFPGFNVQFPVGKLLKTTLPVATAHVGCVMVPTIGAAGGAGTVLIVVKVAGEVQPPVLFIITL